MSTWYSAVVRCPSCTHEFEARFVRGANAGRAPELRQAALAGTLNRPRCPACDRAHETDAVLVYTDPPRGHWISVARREDLGRWSELEPPALAAFHTSLETVGDLLANAPRADPIVRIVFDLDELRERLAIWDAGLDDGIVECVKLDCLRERPMLRRPNERIRFARSDGRMVTMRIIEAREPALARTEFDVSHDVVTRIAGDPAWRERFPALFASGFVSIDRYLT